MCVFQEISLRFTKFDRRLAAELNTTKAKQRAQQQDHYYYSVGIGQLHYLTTYSPSQSRVAERPARSQRGSTSRFGLAAWRAPGMQ